MAEAYQRNPNTECSVCKTAIYRRPCLLQERGGKAYCGQACYGVACRKEVACIMCSTKIFKGRNAKTCSRVCSNKYRAGIKYKIGRPKDKAVNMHNLKSRLFDLRGAKCERCGYATVEILHVHHKDRNRGNNTFDNLEVICPNCHSLEHYFESSLIKKYGGVA